MKGQVDFFIFDKKNFFFNNENHQNILVYEYNEV